MGTPPALLELTVRNRLQMTVDTRYVTQELRRHDRPDRGWKMAAVIDEPASKRRIGGPV